MELECERCKDCGQQYEYVWEADDRLWKHIWGSEGGQLCIPCFTKRCESKGITIEWKASPYQIVGYEPYLHIFSSGEDFVCRICQKHLFDHLP